MNHYVSLVPVFQIIAFFSTCTIECVLFHSNVLNYENNPVSCLQKRKAFITHFGNGIKGFQIKDSSLSDPHFDPGGVRTEEEHLEDLKTVFLFNVAHKLKEGTKFLDTFTVPLSKQKLAVDHFNLYFGGRYAEKSKKLGNIIGDFESNKLEVEETVDKLQDVFLSEILDNFNYTEGISDAQVLNRQVELLYGSDLMASYILLFTSKQIKRILYKYIWSNHAFLDSKKEYLCCNWVVNGGVHEEELHKKFSLGELSNDDLIDIIRLHKAYLSFVKVKSRKALRTLDRNSLVSIFQTIMMKSIWAHYIHEPSNVSIGGNEDNEEEEEDSVGNGYLDNIYEWILKYKNKINNRVVTRKVDYVDEEQYGRLKRSLDSLEGLLEETEEIIRKNSSKSRKMRLKQDTKEVEQEQERKQVKEYLKSLIEYYKVIIDEMKGVCGRVASEENTRFLNNLMKYEDFDLLTLVVIYLSALPELKQVTNKQIYLNYLSLKRNTLIKLLYVSMMRTTGSFVPLLNYFYSGEYTEDEESQKVKMKLIEDQLEEEKKRLAEEVGKEETKMIGEKEDVFIFEVDELKGVVNTNLSNNKLLRKKKIKWNNEMKEVIILGTRRTEEVMASILKHPPHFPILYELLKRNEYTNKEIGKNIETLVSEGSDGKSEDNDSGEEVNKVVRRKKVGNILSMMERRELNELYGQFLEHIYPFNNINPEEKIKGKPMEEEPLGDEDVSVIYDDSLLRKFSDQVSRSKIVETMENYMKSVNWGRFNGLKDNIISFLATLNDGKSEESEEEKILKMLEKDERELREELDDYIKKLEEDPKTLKVRMNPYYTMVNKTGNVFDLLSTPVNSSTNKAGEKSRLYLMDEENVTFIKDPEEKEEYEQKGVKEIQIERRKEEVNRATWKEGAEREGGIKLIRDRNFGDEYLEIWRKLDLNKEMANAAMSYLTTLYEREDPEGDLESVLGDVKREGSGPGFQIRPSLIQMLSIPEILKKKDKNMIISGGVGSGKTLAYLLPIIQILKEDEKRHLREPGCPRCIIMASSTELCNQINHVIKALGHLVKVSSTAICKGHERLFIKNMLEGLIDIVVTTPTRLERYRNYLSLKDLKYLVLEEADTLLNQGFFPFIYPFLQQLPNYRSESKDGVKGVERWVNIIQVSSSINYVKFFESIHSAFNKFIARNELQNKKEEEKQESGEEKQVYDVNLMKIFGKNKERLELYRHIFDYYFSTLYKSNDVFKYDRRIIEDLVGSHQIVDRVGIKRPSKGIKHMFVDSGKDKIRTLIKILKYDLKYSNEDQNVDNYMAVNREEDKQKENDSVEGENRKIIIFCKTKGAVRALDHFLTEANFRPLSTHSNMPFLLRRNNLRKFKDSQRAILVTSEFMSRGLHLDVDVAILFDFSVDPNEYIKKSSILRHLPEYVLANLREKQTKEFAEGGESEVDSGKQNGRVKQRDKICISLVGKKDKVMAEAIKRSLSVEYFPLDKLSNWKVDYCPITGRLKYLTQAGGYFKFQNYLRELQIKGQYDPAHMYKYLDVFREIVKQQFLNSFKKVKLRRIRICKRRRQLMRRLKLIKRWNRAIRLKQRNVSEIDRKKREKDYIYVNFTKDQRSCPPMKIKELKKVRYELLKLKMLEGSNSEKLLKRSKNSIEKFINGLQNTLVEHNKLIEGLLEKFGDSLVVGVPEEKPKDGKETSDVKVFDEVKDKLEVIRSDNKNKEVRRICSLV